MEKKPIYLDLFSGAGGLSEGFIRAGFQPVAHVDSDTAACFTICTRVAKHWYESVMQSDRYISYLKQEISREKLYSRLPIQQKMSIINEEIGEDTLPDIFRKIDAILGERRLDLIIGGPPCQAYSIAGRARDGNGMKGDKRNYLYVFYAEFLKKYKPRFFVFENVTGLLSAKDLKGSFYFDKMLTLFRDNGYETEYKSLSAENYGVLQKRKRIILVGKHGTGSGFFPDPEPWQPGIIVNEMFTDLPPLLSGEGSLMPCKTKPYKGSWLYKAGIRNDNMPVTWHKARVNNQQDLEIYRIAVQLWDEKQERLSYDNLPEHLKTHRNRTSFCDRFKVVSSNLPYSHTLVAHIAKDGHYYIHPDIKQNRSITPREAARIQTFPDDYFFEGINNKPGITTAFRQIGNAVPVLLAQKIAEQLRKNYD